MPGRILRTVENWLLRRCRLLIVSSPAFVSEYFTPTHGRLPSVALLENKVLEGEITSGFAAVLRQRDTTTKTAPVGPPWRIGWFGVIRCQRSLDLLTCLVRQFPGQVEVVMRGRPARGVMPDFDRNRG